RGAFTGAHQARKGKFELAHKGTLFLDEVGELSARVQVGLLRVLQEGELRRLGGEQDVKVDVRLVCATHRDLKREVDQGRFREDLWYRLSGVVLQVPPLRERVDDLPALVARFLEEQGRPELPVAADAWARLAAWRWPGNVRELRAEVVRWCVFAEGRVTLEDLSPELRGVRPASTPTTDGVRPLADVLADAEQQAVRAAWAATGGNISATARALAIDRNTVKRKLAALGLRRGPP
ncbi:MAG: sigma-54-dependent Fis family transcriptional regulator, partial [Myxococcales bacterium]|nr:sigma-54-dependent Fis family transcriptional regulator [Myxococcales bacterium]